VQPRHARLRQSLPLWSTFAAGHPTRAADPADRSTRSTPRSAGARRHCAFFPGRRATATGCGATLISATRKAVSRRPTTEKPQCSPSDRQLKKLVRGLMERRADRRGAGRNSRVGRQSRHTICLWGRRLAATLSRRQLPATASVTAYVRRRPLAGARVLTGLALLDVPLATSGFDNDYVRSATTPPSRRSLDPDFFLLHVERPTMPSQPG